MNFDREQLLGLISDFVATRHGEKHEIKPDTKLLQDGHLDSFALVELIAQMEDRLGLSIDEGDLIPEDFETPETLFERLEQL